jgi:hypothetical protein
VASRVQPINAGNAILVEPRFSKNNVLVPIAPLRKMSEDERVIRGPSKGTLNRNLINKKRGGVPIRWPIITMIHCDSLPLHIHSLIAHSLPICRFTTYSLPKKCLFTAYSLSYPLVYSMESPPIHAYSLYDYYHYYSLGYSLACSLADSA